jgi:hypothetical protein
MAMHDKLLVLACLIGIAIGCKGEVDSDAGPASEGGSSNTQVDAAQNSSTNDAAISGNAGSAGQTANAGTGGGGTNKDAATLDHDAAIAADSGTLADPLSTDRNDFGLGGASHCAGASFLLCEDFESGAIDSNTWTVDTWGKGSAAVDTMHAARGTHAVHISEPADVSRVMLRETKTFATTGNHFFGRFFLYLPYNADALSCPGGNCTNLVHWTAAAAGGAYVENNTTYHPDVRAVGAVNQNLLVNLDGGPKAEVGVSDDDSAPTGYKALDQSHVGQWMCFEFEYVGEGASAEVRVYWDGQEHPALHYSTNHRGDKGELWAIPKYDYLDFGFTHYQNYSSMVSGFDAWLDEIAVDDQRIGCVR